MKEIVISNSNKKRQGKMYERNYYKKEVTIIKDGLTRYWKQVVFLTDNGFNRKGKKIFVSRTCHLPV